MQDPRSAAALRPHPDPSQSARRLRMGVLSNPLSTRNRKDMTGLQALLSARADLPHLAIDDWARLDFEQRCQPG